MNDTRLLIDTHGYINVLQWLMMNNGELQIIDIKRRHYTGARDSNRNFDR